MSNYQVNLQFTADTNQAKTQLQSLQQQLSAIVNTPIGIGEKLTPSIQQASHAAAELKVHLQNATNVNTGTLDFGKLNNSIKQSGMTLSEYGAKLQSLGPKGQQAFMALANSVAAAEVPLRRSNGALAGMLTTLKNTAKWQLSSSLLHGFIRTVQSAYGYAQDLNESLNNIRIVTGQNIDQMAKFAAEANKAAKALSTTTTAYTNASLIYYQQGLSDAQVQERTNVTIKMANASRQSAEVVSDQLTAIWNNFDNGTKSLEYYADVVTALGAATASSSKEIAAGLEKFASVAETVGLSYEYATAALATVTATTRQSADVVGTAFKTLFARLQDLKLGETLDDGTTLGTYSENLAKVGVQIKDSSGQLKDMDVILEEVALKWQTLDRDQQVALAKGVAGIRQYNTFMSLMSNWDFMEKNLQTVESSSGTLQKQADIYAESWEAAQNRVRTSAEKLYKVLFNDEFFIDLTNGFGKLIDKVGDFIQSIGGLGGVLSSLGFIVTKVFAQQMAQGFRNLVYNIQMSTEAGRLAVQQAKQMEMTKFAGMMAKSSASTATELQTKNVYSQELQLQTELIANSERMTAEEQKKYQILLEQHRTIGQQSITLQKQVELLREQNASTSLEIMGEGMLNNSGMTRKDSFAMMNAEMEKMRTGAKGLGEVTMALDTISKKSEASKTDITRLKAALEQAGMSQDDIQGLSHCFDDLQAHGKTATSAMEEIKATLNTINSEKIRQVLKAAGIEEGTAQYNRLTQALKQYIATGSEAHIKETQLKTTNDNLKVSFESLLASIKKAGVNMQDWATHLSGFVSGIMSAGMLVSSINGLIKTLESPDTSGWEKFGSILTSVAMIAMSFTGVIKGVTSVIHFAQAALNKETLAKVANVVASHLQAKAAARVAKTKKDEAVSTGVNAAALDKENKEKAEGIILDKASGRSGKLTTGTYKSGPQQGKTWYRHGGRNITADKYAELSKSGGGAAESGGLLKPGTLQTLGRFAGGAAAVAAAVAIVATTITAAVASFNRFETAAKEAAEASKMAADGYNTAKTSYEELTTTTSTYNDTVKSLEEMTKGTVKYNEALLKANESALKLINNYKDLAGNYTIENGLIVIDEDALAKVQQKELEKMGKTQAMSTLSNIEASERQGEANRANFNREMNSRSDNGYTVGNAAVTTASGAAAGFLGTVGVATMIGSAAGPIGMAIGAAVGAIVGAISGIVATELAGAQSKAEQQATNNVIQYVQKNGNDIFGAKDAKEFGQMLKDANLEIKDEKLVESLYANREALQELTSVEVARLAKERAEWDAAFAAYNMGNEEYTNAENQTFLNNEGHKVSQDQEVIDEVTTGVEDLWKGGNKDFWDAYLTEVLGEESASKGVGENYQIVNMAGGAVTLQKKNAEGVWETVGNKNGLDEDAAQQQLINARLMQKASEGIEDYVVDYETLSKELKTAEIKDKDLINKILSDYSEGKAIDLSQFAPDMVAEIVTGAIVNPDLRNKVEKAVADYNKNVPSWWNDLTEEEKAVAWTMDFDDDATLAEVRQAVAAMQGYLDNNELIAKLTIADKMQQALTDMNWDELHSLFTKSKEDGGAGMSEEQWLEFLELGSMEAMQQWLADWKKESRQSGVSENAENVGEAQTYYDTSVENYESAVEERKNAETEDTKAQTAKTQAATTLTTAQEHYDEVSADTSAYYNNAEAFMAEVIAPKQTEYGVQQAYSFEGLMNYLTNFQGTSEEQQLLLANAQQLLSLSEGYWEYLSGGNTDENWTYTTTDGQVYTRDDIGLAWDAAQTNMANYMAGYTDINGAVIGGTAEQEAAHVLKYDSYGALGYNNLVTSRTYDDSSGMTSSNAFGFFNTLVPFLNQLDPTVMQARQDRDTAQSNYDAASATAAATETNLEAAQEKEDAAYSTAYGEKGASETYQTALQTDITLQEALRKEIEATGLEMKTFEAYRKQIAEGKGFENDTGENYGIEWLNQLQEEDISAYNNALNDLSLMQARLSRGYKTLGENWENWNKVMSDSEASIDDIAEIMPELNKTMADILNWDTEDVELLPPDFAQKHWDVIQDIYNGVDGAQEKLAGLATNEYVLSLNIDTEGLDADALAAYNTMTTWLQDMPDLEVGMTLNDTGMYEAFQALLDSGAVTADQMTEILSRASFDPEFTTKKIPVESAVYNADTATYTVEYLDTEGNLQTKTVSADMYHSADEGAYIEIPVINGTKTTYTGGGGVTQQPPSKKGGGGGGSKPKKIDGKKKTDVVDRYKEITDSLDDVTKISENASKAMDGLYGTARIKNMEKVNDLLKNEIDLLGKKRKEALGYLAEDKQALNDAATEAGVTLEFDADGDISNYTDIMTDLYNQLDAEIEEANADGNATEEEQEKIDAIQEKIDNLKDAMADYEETKSTLFEIDQEEIDKFNEQLSNNFEQINAQIELDIEINEMDLQYIEYILSKIEEDVYSQAEAAALTADKLDVYDNNLETYINGFNELNTAYQNGEITSASYAEGMKTIAEGLYEQLGNIEELDTAMEDYYGNTIKMAQEEISKYTEMMENASSVLDHYNSLLGVFGLHNDYELMGTVLQAQADVAEDAYEVSKKNYEAFAAEADARKKAYDEAVAAGETGYGLELLEQQWLDAEAAAAEAQDQMLSDAATWAEQLRAILENSLGKFAQELEDALTGEFGSFENISTAMERANSLQEEFLTNTNKVYETNKMMRTAQKEIDKTTNIVAKQKLKQFITETAAMQEQGKLSQYELDIQQAKYDLLLAEIALKEAQNAKSTVRLQRDSEGNFGYVYTADQSAIEDAQQKFDDAQNTLYNKGLEGANNYAQKYQETMSEMYDTLGEIQQKYLDGEYQSEAEYNAAMEAARSYYYEQLQNYSSLYQVALTTDSQVVADAWSSDFGDMTTRTEEWMGSVDSYIGQVKTAFSSWESQMSQIREQTIGKDLNELVNKTKTLTDKSNELKNKLTAKGGLIDALSAELDAVINVTNAYREQRDAMQEIINKGEEIALQAQNNARKTATNESDIAPGSQVTVKGTATWATGVGKADDFSGTALATGKGYTVIRWDEGRKNVLISDGAGNYGWVKTTDLVGFDSGGYTGEWGSYGKLAMLHEKEMVLNQEDTANLLASMEFLNRILEVIDLQTISSQLGGILSSPEIINSNNETFEQNVHIEASFPNATNHSEIEEAFNNLVNAASQYANRR